MGHALVALTICGSVAAACWQAGTLAVIMEYPFSAGPPRVLPALQDEEDEQHRLMEEGEEEKVALGPEEEAAADEATALRTFRPKYESSDVDAQQHQRRKIRGALWAAFFLFAVATILGLARFSADRKAAGVSE
jgi:hypothetical protein